MHFNDPVSQTFEDEVLHHGVVAVHGVAASRVVRVFSARGEHVIGGVVEPPEG